MAQKSRPSQRSQRERAGPANGTSPQRPAKHPPALIERLRTVLDPEMDESILERGFVESLEAADGHVTVTLRLPTVWCAPNFVYMMAEDIRRQLLKLETVQEVTVHLKDHFESARIEAAVNAGQLFKEAFPQEAFSDLEELREVFLRKGFFKRQEQLLRCLLDAGLSLEEIAALKLRDLSVEGQSYRVEQPTRERPCLIPARVVLRYLERRADLGISNSLEETVITEPDGEPIPASGLQKHLATARITRLSMDANASLCSALLEARIEKSQSALLQIGGTHVPHR